MISNHIPKDMSTSIDKHINLLEKVSTLHNQINSTMTELNEAIREVEQDATHHPTVYDEDSSVKVIRVDLDDYFDSNGSKGQNIFKLGYEPAKVSLYRTKATPLVIDRFFLCFKSSFTNNHNCRLLELYAEPSCSNVIEIGSYFCHGASYLRKIDLRHLFKDVRCIRANFFSNTDEYVLSHVLDISPLDFPNLVIIDKDDTFFLRTVTSQQQQVIADIKKDAWDRFNKTSREERDYLHKKVDFNKFAIYDWLCKYR